MAKHTGPKEDRSLSLCKAARCGDSAVRGMLAFGLVIQLGAGMAHAQDSDAGNSAQEASVSAAAEKDVSIKNKTASAVLGLKEFRRSFEIEVPVSQARYFRVPDRIIMTSVSDPAIAQPVVVAENKVCILASHPGQCSIAIWNDGGKYICFDVIVTENSNAGPTLGKLFNPIAQYFHSEKGGITKLHSAHKRLGFEVFDSDAAREQYKKTLSHIQNLGHENVTAGTAENSNIASPSHQVHSLAVPGGDITLEYGITKVSEKVRHIYLRPSAERAYSTDKQIRRVIVSDASISEPVVVAINRFIVLGKRAGTSQIALTGEDNAEESLEVHVSPFKNRLASAFAVFAEIFGRRSMGDKHATPIPPATMKVMEISEDQSKERIALDTTTIRRVRTDCPIDRMLIAEPNIAAPVLLARNEFDLVGTTPGNTTLFLWDSAGKTATIDLHVSDHGSTASVKSRTVQKTLGGTTPADRSRTQSDSYASSMLEIQPKTREVEFWYRAAKDVISVPLCNVVDADKIVPVTDIMTEGPSRTSQEYLKYLNNQAVIDLGKSEYVHGIIMLQKALRLAPSYERARGNLGVAYNNYGLTFQGTPKKALSLFHAAVYLEPTNLTSVGNLECFLKKTGIKVDDASARVTLGDEAMHDKDLAGGLIEYQAALNLHEDAKVRAKLDDVTHQIKVRQDWIKVHGW